MYEIHSELGLANLQASCVFAMRARLLEQMFEWRAVAGARRYAERRAYTCATVCVVLDHRLQILLDDERYRKVEREARRRRVSIAAVIRDALDRLPVDVNGRRAAIDAILAAEPMPLPADPAALRRELDDATDRIGA